MKILVISGSKRGSLNTRLARLIAELRPADEVTVVDNLSRIRFYDADLEAAGTPEAVTDLRYAVTAADVVADLADLLAETIDPSPRAMSA